MRTRAQSGWRVDPPVSQISLIPFLELESEIAKPVLSSSKDRKSQIIETRRAGVGEMTKLRFPRGIREGRADFSATHADAIIAGMAPVPQESERLQRQIDQLVYEFYGLSDPEIQIVESWKHSGATAQTSPSL